MQRELIVTIKEWGIKTLEFDLFNFKLNITFVYYIVQLVY